MPRPCFKLYAELEKLQKDQFRDALGNIARLVGGGTGQDIHDAIAKDPEAALYQVAEKSGLNPNTVRTVIYNGFGEAGMKSNYEDWQQVSTKAVQNADSLRTPEGVAEARAGIMERIKKATALTVGSVQGLPINFKDALISYGGIKKIFAVAKDVYTGSQEGDAFKNRLKSLHKSVTEDGFNMENRLFREATGLAMAARNSTGNGFDMTYLGALEGALGEIQKDNPGFGDRVGRIIGATREIIGNAEVRKFIESEHYNLQKIGVALKQSGEIENPRESYFANMVRMTSDSNGDSAMERLLFKSKMSSTDFARAKKFRSGVEAFLNGYEPVSFEADEVMSIYHTRVGERLSRQSLAKDIRDNEEKWKVAVSSDLNENAFIIRKEGDYGERKTESNETYKDLGSLPGFGRRFAGILVHPIVYRGWASKIGAIPTSEGWIGTYRKLNETLKGVAFGLSGLYHPVSLAKKAFTLAAGMQALEAGAASRAGVESFNLMAKPWSMIREGLDHLSNHEPEIVKAAENGVNFSAEQFERNLIESHYYDKAGEKKQNLWHMIATVNGLSDWVNDGIFHTFQPGLKAALVMRLTKSQVFKDWVTEKDEKYAYQNLASLLNNHLGGQNLVSLGRSKFVQAFLSAGLLAPDFQESKMKRIGGNFSSDPNLASAYRASTAVETIMVATTLLVIQQIADSLTGHSRTPRSWIHDSVGHWMDIRLGQTDDGRWIYASPFGAEKEDYRPLAEIFVKYMDAFHPSGMSDLQDKHTDIPGGKSKLQDLPFLKKIYLPILKTIAHEAENKSAPMLKNFLNLTHEEATLTDRQSSLPFVDVPMSMSPVVMSAFGGFANKSANDATMTAAALLSSMAGVPMSAGKKQDGGKKNKGPMF